MEKNTQVAKLKQRNFCKNGERTTTLLVVATWWTSEVNDTELHLGRELQAYQILVLSKLLIHV